MMSDINQRIFDFALRIIKLCQFLNKTYAMENNILAK